jgi:hypothetical protein
LNGVRQGIAPSRRRSSDNRRLKEWAYAGVMINMVGAAASQVARHESPISLVAPAMFAGLTMLSWAWRPPSRRL